MALRVLVVSHAAVVDVNQEPFAALRDEGAEVTVIAPRALTTDIRGRIALSVLEGFEANVVGLPIALGGYRRALGGQRGIHLIVYRGLARAIAEANPDVIFVEEEPYSLAARQAARIALGRKTPFVVHENQNIVRTLPPPFGSFRRQVLERAAGVTVRNKAAADLVRAHGFDGPISSLPHGVDPARFKAQRRSMLERPVVGFVGRLVPEKGIMDLIAAVASLRERTGAGSLLVVGDGPLLAEARARAASHGIPAEFTGALDHAAVPQWYAGMDVVAIPSHTTRTWMEQFGRIVIEANAAGVPVVVSDSGELPETVAATGGGVIVPEGNIDLLRDAIAKVCEDEAWRTAVGSVGADAVSRLFTPRAIAEVFHRFLCEVAG